MKQFITVVLLTMIGTSIVSAARPSPVESNPGVGMSKVQIPKQLEASASASNEITGTFKAAVKTPPVASGGSKEQWMAQAGIPQSDWQYVDYIVSHESGWKSSSINPSSGSCGLLQQLPCGKWSHQWDDPVGALIDGTQYANERYGSWAGAFSAWTNKHWW